MSAEVGVATGLRAAVFIAASLDGFIAKRDGDITWLTGRGEHAGETGYDAFMSGIDTVVMGRATYEKVLTFGMWPYEGRRVAVASTSLPVDADERITVYRSVRELLDGVAAQGGKSLYVDGGQLIQSFLRAEALDELIITTVPILLGGGLPLFGELDRDVDLEHEETTVLGAGFVQSRYRVVQAR